jgi:hypothetical protein
MKIRTGFVSENKELAEIKPDGMVFVEQGRGR